MMKRTLALLLLVTFSLSAGLALAEESKTPVDAYIANNPVVSQEPVELHIGIVQENLADNLPLELAFSHKYPKGKIVYHYLSTEQLSAYLLSNEAMLDLLILGTRLSMDYAKQGVFVNLYETPLLDSWPQSWIDMKKQAETDGKLYGFPKAIYQSFFGWNDSLAEHIKVKMPEGAWTWEDYLQLCKTLPYDINGDGIKEFFLMRGHYHSSGLSGFINDFLEQYAYQYALQGGAFQTKEFEHLMTIFMDIYSSGALVDMRGNMPTFQGADAALISAFSSEDGFIINDWIHTFLLPPTLDSNEPGYVGALYSYSLLHNAPNSKVALDFLQSAFDPNIQNIISHESQIFTKKIPEYYAVNPAISLYDAFAPDEKGNMTYTVSNTDNYIVYLWTDEYEEISEVAFQKFIFMREHLLPNTGDWYELSRLWFELMPQYMNNTLQLSEMTAALDSRMAMMQKE